MDFHNCELGYLKNCCTLLFGSWSRPTTSPVYRGPGQPSLGLQRSTCCYSWTKTASATMWFRSQQHRSKRRPHAQGAVFEQTQLSEFPLSAHVCNVVKFCRFMEMSPKVSFIKKNVYILEIIASLHSVREMLLWFFPSTYTSGGSVLSRNVIFLKHSCRCLCYTD